MTEASLTKAVKKELTVHLSCNAILQIIMTPPVASYYGSTSCFTPFENHCELNKTPPVVSCLLKTTAN